MFHRTSGKLQMGRRLGLLGIVTGALVTTSLAVGSLAVATAADVRTDEPRWPQFRGPGGLAAAADRAGTGAKYPVDFGPASEVLWKTVLPAGNSSPAVWGDRIFLTAFDKSQKLLETLGLDRRTGKILWRRAAPPVGTIETSLHPANGPATPTAVCDRDRVYVYFGSYGLLAYDHDGKEQWKKPLPVPGTTFGSGSSPILAGDLLLLTCQGKGASLLAVRPQTGATVWKKERPRFGAGYATPLLLENRGTPEIVLVQPRGVVAYDLKDGTEQWWVSGLFGGGIPSPALGDGLVFAVAHFPGGDPEDRMRFPVFDELVKQFDADKDGLLTQKEVPKDLVFYNRGSTNPDDNIVMDDMFPFIDKNKDGRLSREEWIEAQQAFAKRESAMLAIRPGGTGEVAKDRVVWKEQHALPEVPSPLYYQGRLYVVTNGGIASCYDAQTGKMLYRRRLGAGGFFYASPVAANGNLYAASYNGVVVVFKAGDQGEVLARNDLGERIVATPALADGRIYVRTEGHLYAFGQTP
jgi:outer membrane protein assembly factor BamB